MTAAFVGLMLLPGVATAQKHDPARAIIVFGGFGYFNDAQQQWLSGLIGRDAQDRSAFAEEGRGLETRLVESARPLLRGRATRWSAHDVIFDEDDLRRAFGAATREKGRDTGAMFDEFDRAYMIVLSSGFEHHAVLRTAYQRQVTYHAYTAAGVSASLVDLRNSGNILLSSAALAQLQSPQLVDADEPSSPVWASRYAEAYAAAASQALRQLMALAERSDPGDAGWDSYMVTGAMIPSLTGAAVAASRRAADVFEWQMSAETGNFCAPVNGCANGSRSCGAMTGLLVNAISSALSQAGHMVLPPLPWASGIRTPGEAAQYQLNLPSTALPGLTSSTSFTFDPKRATFKAIALLGGVAVSSGSERLGAEQTDVYNATVDSLISRTDPTTCASKPADQRLLDVKRVGVGMAAYRRAVNAPPLDIDSQRFEYLRAMNDAATRIAKSLGGR